MKEGLIYGLDFEDYIKIDAVNQSLLGHLKRSPAHAKAALSAPRRDTPALIMGQAAHCLVFEKDDFNQRFIRKIEADRRTTAGKQAYESWLPHAEGKLILSIEDYETAFRIAEAVATHNEARELVKDNVFELTLVWFDKVQEVWCKARLDGYDEDNGNVNDLKTTESAHIRDFVYSILKYGYYRQAAWYMRGLRALGLPAKQFCFIAAEKESPFGVSVYRMNERTLSAGDAENTYLLARYAECKRSDLWPCYSESVVDIGLPENELTKLEEQYDIA